MVTRRAPTVVIGVDDPRTWQDIERAVISAGGEVVGDAVTGRSLVALGSLLEPDIVVVDLTIAYELGPSLVEQLLAVMPDAQLVVFEPVVADGPLGDERVWTVARDDAAELQAVLSALVLEREVTPRRG